MNNNLYLFCQLSPLDIFYLDPLQKGLSYMKVDNSHAIKMGGEIIEFNPYILTFKKDYSHAK